MFEAVAPLAIAVIALGSVVLSLSRGWVGAGGIEFYRDEEPLSFWMSLGVLTLVAVAGVWLGLTA